MCIIHRYDTLFVIKKVEKMFYKTIQSLFLCVLIGTSSIQSGNENTEPACSLQQIVLFTALAGAGTAAIYASVQPQYSFTLPQEAFKDKKSYELHLPKSFAWGAASSAYQSEGGLAQSSWTHYKTKEGQIHDAGPCLDSWNRLDEDIACLEKLGVTTYRFSIAWERIQATENSWDERAVQKYVNFCKTLQEHNIKPIITLHHYSDPIWFMEKGGFSNPENNHYFIHFCEKVVAQLAPHCTYFLTFNQPVAYAIKSYQQGMMPPYETSGAALISETKASKTAANILHMHTQLYERLKKLHPNLQISITHQYVQCLCYNSFNPLDQIIARIADKLTNQTFTDFFKDPVHNKTLDFMALSYYCPLRFSGTHPFSFYPEEVKLQSEQNFRHISAWGFYDALVWAQQFNKPIFVVESGFPTATCEKRITFLQHYIYALDQAITAGMNIIGYCYWALLDNFEWTEGFKTQFGLFSVDRDHDCKRTIKPSGIYYADVISTNSLSFT